MLGYIFQRAKIDLHIFRKSKKYRPQIRYRSYKPSSSVIGLFIGNNLAGEKQTSMWEHFFKQNTFQKRILFGKVIRFMTLSNIFDYEMCKLCFPPAIHLCCIHTLTDNSKIFKAPIF